MGGEVQGLQRDGSNRERTEKGTEVVIDCHQTGTEGTEERLQQPTSWCHLSLLLLPRLPGLHEGISAPDPAPHPTLSTFPLAQSKRAELLQGSSKILTKPRAAQFKDSGQTGRPYSMRRKQLRGLSLRGRRGGVRARYARRGRL